MSFLRLVFNRTTIAYIQGPVFVTASLAAVLYCDPHAPRELRWWYLPIFFGYSLGTVLFATARLQSGAWTIHKWADRLLVLSAPAAMFYGYIAYLAPAYFLVPAIGVLGAGLPLFGVGKNRMWWSWFLLFATTYLAASFLLAAQVNAPPIHTNPNATSSIQTRVADAVPRGSAGDLFASAPVVFVLSLAAMTVMLFWLTRTSSYARRVADRAAKNLIHARKSRRELDQTNRELLAERERVDAELRIARKIQESILPTTERFAEHAKISVSARYLALEGIGGDYYDFVDLGKNRFGFFMADVSGHGVPAALITTMTKVAFTNHSRTVGENPAQILGAINAVMYEFLSDLGHYLTAYSLVIDLERGRATYANGGHPPALLHRRSDDSIEEWTTPTSFFLGVEPDFTYQSREVALRAGDRIIIYTDGLTEMQNAAREFYGDRRLEQFLREQSGEPAETLLDQLLEDLHRFTSAGGTSANRDRGATGATSHGFAPFDDIAVLCIDYLDTL